MIKYSYKGKTMSKFNREKRKENAIIANQVYTDHDPDIVVSLTGDTDLHCIRVQVGNVSMKMHTRSAIDLSQKLQKAITDWIGNEAFRLLNQHAFNGSGDHDRP
jgi:hypothetical protein